MAGSKDILALFSQRRRSTMQVIGNPNEALTARGGNALVDDSYYAYTMFRENKGKAA